MPKSTTPGKPIIFSTPMVQAILAGRKTQTRRVVKPQNFLTSDTGYVFDTIDQVLRNSTNGAWVSNRDGRTAFTPPYTPGNILWAREAWRPAMDGYTGVDFGGYWYRADSATPEHNDDYNPWRSPFLMPRAAARIFLRVTNVRVERLQDISEEDAFAEGCDGEVCYDAFGEPACWKVEPTEQYANLWDKLNAKRGYGWDTNPWVWAIEFEVINNEKI